MNTKLVRIGTAACLALALSACGAAPDKPAADKQVPARKLASNGAYYLPTSAAAREFLSIQASREAAADSFYYDQKLAEALPNNLVSIDGAPEGLLAKGVVIGTVKSVDPGQAYAVDGADADSGTTVAFDDPNAAWRVAVVTVAAQHNLTRSDGQVVDHPGDVKIGVVIAGDSWQQQMDGIKALSDVVVVLDNHRSYDFEQPAINAVARNGALFGDVDANGKIGFPALDEASASYIGTLDTVPALLNAATGSTIHRVLNLVDGVLTQVVPALPLNILDSPAP